ncbi:MAG: Gfo/Idh/MocA family oxidoreductase [Acidimicrobiia bacterium]|nr:Gfo/Idh/MocA family oxidoreductase [Acidimicrobiia bacterium]
MPREVRFGVIGCGYWGPNHIRNLSVLRGGGAVMAMAADRDSIRRHRVAQLYPHVEVVVEADTILTNPDIDAVVIATPVSTHYPIAKQALLNGKHVLVEKPFVTCSAHARELIDLARERDLRVMVGHTFEYTAAVNRIRELVKAGELGDVLYVRSLRVNLGLFQTDVNVLWDLAPHDISILRYVLDRPALAVSAVGTANVTEGVEDVVTLSVEFEGGIMCNVIVSWLDPKKVREMTIVGDRKMLVYDDISTTEKIRIFDKGVAGPRDYDSFGEFQYSYRYGDIVTPFLDEHEPLREEVTHFLHCIQNGTDPRSDGESGAAVVEILEAAQTSLSRRGARIELGTSVVDLTELESRADVS